MKDKKEHKRKKAKKEHKQKKVKKEESRHHEAKITKISMEKPESSKELTAIDLNVPNGISSSNSIDMEPQQRSKPLPANNLPQSNSRSKSTSTKPSDIQNQRSKTKTYVSASDSDSTDNDNRSLPKRSITSKPVDTAPSTSNTPSTTKRSLSDSDSDSTDNEVHQQSKLPPASRNKSGSTLSTAKQLDHASSKKPMPTTKSSTKQYSTAKTKGYASDSNSDSTDDDTRAPKRRSILNKASLASNPTPAPSKPVKPTTNPPLSDSDSDSTDNDTRPPARRSILNIKASATNAASRSKPNSSPAKSATKRAISDSDSDSTDNEAQQPSKRLTTKQPQKVIRSEQFRLPSSKGGSGPRTKEYICDSSDDDEATSDGNDNTHTKQQQHRSNPAEVASRLMDDNNSSDGSDSEYGEVVEAKFKTRKQIQRKTKLGEYSNNRLQQTQMYRGAYSDPAMEYKRRYVDEADKYNVQHDFFISDSESDSDSNDDYSGTPCPWHVCMFNGSRWKTQLEAHKDWKIKTGKFSQMENIRLEKRVKKICRREGLDLAGFRDKMTESVMENKLFWRKIAKVFPDRPLNLIVITCRNRYNEYAYQNKPWTDDMDRQLVEYIKIYGRNYSKIESLMNRPRKELQVHATELLRPESKSKKLEPWTDEQIQVFYDLVKAEKDKSTWTNWKDFATTHYKGKRTGFQCQDKWRSRNSSNPMTISTKLAIIRLLAKQKHQKETELNMTLVSEELGYPARQIKTFYLNTRSTIPDFEKKNVPDILSILDKRFTEMERSMQE